MVTKKKTTKKRAVKSRSKGQAALEMAKETSNNSGVKSILSIIGGVAALTIAVYHCDMKATLPVEVVREEIFLENHLEDQIR